MKSHLLLLFSMSFLIFNGCLNRLTGSGNVRTVTYAVADFNNIEIEDACDADIRFGEECSVIVEIDDNLANKVVVDKNSGTLRIGLKDDYSYSNFTFRAIITVPACAKITGSDASDIQISGFDSVDSLHIEIEDASALLGTVAIGTLKCHAEDASEVVLSGIVNRALLTVEDASDCSLRNLECQTVVATLDDASELSVSVIDSITADIEGASSLTVYGEPAYEKIEKGHASSYIKR